MLYNTSSPHTFSTVTLTFVMVFQQDIFNEGGLLDIGTAKFYLSPPMILIVLTSFASFLYCSPCVIALTIFTLSSIDIFIFCTSKAI